MLHTLNKTTSNMITYFFIIIIIALFLVHFYFYFCLAYCVSNFCLYVFKTVKQNKPSHEERSASRTVPSNESSLKKREGNTVKLNLKQTKILLKFSKKRGHSTVCTDKGAQMNSKLQRNE